MNKIRQKRTACGEYLRSVSNVMGANDHAAFYEGSAPKALPIK